MLPAALHHYTVPVGLTAILVMSGCAGGPSVGSEAPPFTAVDTEGQLVSSEEHLGRIVLIDFWATWCPPCREASPHIQALHEQYAEDPGVIILGIHAAEGGDPAAYMRENSYTFRVIPDGAAIAKAFNIRGVPQYILLGSDGRVAWRHIGFRAGDEAIIAKAVEAALLQ